MIAGSLIITYVIGQSKLSISSFSTSLISSFLTGSGSDDPTTKPATVVAAITVPFTVAFTAPAETEYTALLTVYTPETAPQNPGSKYP